jgi:hypothetical protein
VPPGPRGLIEEGCQYRGEGGKRVSVRYPSPRGWGTASSFYRPRRGSLQTYCIVLAKCGGMAYSAMEWMVVLANFSPDKAPLRVLCPSRSGFEGCSVGISPLVVVRASARGSG